MSTNTSPAAADARRLIRLAEVRRLTGLSTTGVYKRMAEADFPERVRLGGRAVAWVESEVQAWVEARIAQREPADGAEAEAVEEAAA